MAEHPSWRSLEKLLEGSADVQQAIAKKYPNEMVKWSVLRSRQGRFCPMARGVLKMICYMEMRNKAFVECISEEKWKDSCLE